MAYTYDDVRITVCALVLYDSPIAHLWVKLVTTYVYVSTSVNDDNSDENFN